jgi:DNA-directed RNA polymerase specialized sigma24 family protein
MYAARDGRANPISHQRRDAVEHMLRLADQLPPAERSLVQAVYDRGLSAADLARAAGLPPWSVRRRLRRILARIASPVFAAVLRLEGDWPPRRRAVARAVWIEGLSQREAARSTGLSLHHARMEIERIRAALEAAGVDDPTVRPASEPESDHGDPSSRRSHAPNAAPGRVSRRRRAPDPPRARPLRPSSDQ